MPINSEMRIENGKLILGRAACTNCMGDGLKAKQIPCRTCNGTGNGKRGGKGQCKKCYGSGHEYDHVNKIPCPDCTAKGLDPNTAAKATLYDSMPKGMFESFEFRVLRSSRPQTWNEAYLGLGSVFSVTDYGRHKELTDEQLIDAVKKSANYTQACKVAKDDGTVADYIAIVTNDNGYVVTAIYDGSKG